MYTSGHTTEIIDWNFSIGEPAFDAEQTIKLIMNILPNISNDYTLEIASKNNEQYRNAYQSVKPMNDKAVANCRVSHCTCFLLHRLSAKKRYHCFLSEHDQKPHNHHRNHHQIGNSIS
jgi:hypothetical protein